MLIETAVTAALKAFLTKIAVSVVKAGVVQYAFNSIEIYSAFQAVSSAINYIRSDSSISTLSEWGITVVSDYMGESVADKVLQIGHDNFVVEKQPSGIYIASQIIPPFRSPKIERAFFSGNIKKLGDVSVERGFLSPNIKKVGRQKVQRSSWTGKIKQIGDIEVKRGFFGGIKSIGNKKVKRGILGGIKEIGGQKIKRKFLSRDIKEIPPDCLEAGYLALIEEEEERERRRRGREELDRRRSEEFNRRRRFD
jgi:hypothetical protein